MKLSYSGDEFLVASVLCRDFSKAISADKVKGLGHVQIGIVQVNILFLTPLPPLSTGEHHVDRPRSLRKPY